MPADINKKSFDDGTLIKLEILRQYLRKWLPVFMKDQNRTWHDVGIYDLFAGSGTDKDGNPGSPLIILDEIKYYCDEIEKRKMSVFLVLNEAKKRKAKRLTECCNTKLEICKSSAGVGYSCPNTTKSNCSFQVHYADDDFQQLFQELEPLFKGFTLAPQFMFLDQYGIKHITKEIFTKIVSLSRTDFLFFISSSFIARFIELPEFAAYIKLTRAAFEESDPLHCHRVICDYYRSLVPAGVEYYIAPFSIKKGKNVYGLIFGSHNMNLPP
jgi:three-Cys-motif partner protein